MAFTISIARVAGIPTAHAPASLTYLLHLTLVDQKSFLSLSPYLHLSLYLSLSLSPSLDPSFLSPYPSFPLLISLFPSLYLPFSINLPSPYLPLVILSSSFYIYVSPSQCLPPISSDFSTYLFYVFSSEFSISPRVSFLFIFYNFLSVLSFRSKVNADYFVLFLLYCFRLSSWIIYMLSTFSIYLVYMLSTSLSI